MSDKVYKGDIGTEIILDCQSDISDGTSYAIAVKKPDGVTVTWVAELVPGETTRLRYYTKANDLDQAGIYHLQAQVALLLWGGRGGTATLYVYDGFE